MTFNDVLNDIRKLVGLELQSIRPGAAITILEVDEERACLLIRTTQGQTKSRPIGELETIWNEMNNLPAVHVEGVLHGSGTSRNQPETILANLPYVEWLRINNKKHISFVGKPTHPFGTLKQMDSISAAEISRKSDGALNSNKTKTVVVSQNVSDTIGTLQKALTGKVVAIEKGIYSFESTTLEILIIASYLTDLPIGSYTVLPPCTIYSKRVIDLCDEAYFVINTDEVQLLVRKK